MPTTPASLDRISWRPITPADGPFLFRVYASTRAAEMAIVDWSDEQKQQFLVFQFNAQHTHYTAHYREADFGIIELSGQPIGRLYINESPKSIHILDIALLPEFCGRGIGTDLLSGILRQAANAGLPVEIQVEINNPAMRLYERLGFQRIENIGMHWQMEYRHGAVLQATEQLQTQEVSACQ